MIYYENEFGSVAENVEEFSVARLKEQRQSYEQVWRGGREKKPMTSVWINSFYFISWL